MWNSLQEVVADLRLNVSVDDPGAIEDALRRELVALHPDSNGGHFESAAEKERYHRIGDAIAFVRRARPTALAVRSSELTALAREVAIALREMPPPPGVTRNDVIGLVRRDTREASRLPKITSGVLLSLSSAMFAFLGVVKDHPVFGPLLQNVLFVQALVGLWAVSGLGFGLLWVAERATDREVRRLLSETAVEEAFLALCDHGEKREGRFTRRGVIEALTSDRPLSPLRLLKFRIRPRGYHIREWLSAVVGLRPRLDGNAAEEIAAFYLQRWQERGAIAPAKVRDAAQWFEITRDVPEDHHKGSV